MKTCCFVFSDTCAKLGLAEIILNENTDPGIQLYSMGSDAKQIQAGEVWTLSGAVGEVTFDIVAEEELYFGGVELMIKGYVTAVQIQLFQLSGVKISEVCLFLAITKMVDFFLPTI